MLALLCLVLMRFSIYKLISGHRISSLIALAQNHKGYVQRKDADLFPAHTRLTVFGGTSFSSTSTEYSIGAYVAQSSSEPHALQPAHTQVSSAGACRSRMLYALLRFEGAFRRWRRGPKSSGGGLCKCICRPPGAALPLPMCAHPGRAHAFS